MSTTQTDAADIAKSSSEEEHRKVDGGTGSESDADSKLKFIRDFWEKYAERKLPAPSWIAARNGMHKSRALVRPLRRSVGPGRKIRRNARDPRRHGSSLYHKTVRLLESAEKRATDKSGFARPNFYSASLVDNPDVQSKEILIPDETVAFFAGVLEKFSQSENIWFMRLHGGCRVHILPTTESSGQDRKVVISGSPRAVEVTIQRIMVVKKRQERGDPLVDIQKPPLPILRSHLALGENGRTVTSMNAVRGVWGYVSRPGADFDTLVASWPSLTTVRQFAEHVEQLTKSERSPGHHTPHRQRVAMALRDLFSHADKEHLISTLALNTAVTYLLKQHYRDFVRGILNRAGHVATTETFNIILKSVARNQNIVSFRTVVVVMRRLRIAPDARTWLAFLDSLVSPLNKAHLVRVLERKGYLQDRSIVRTLLQVMVKDLFKAHLRDGRTVREFFYKTIMVAGSNWFPPSLIKQMFTVTVQLRNVHAMQELLKVCKENQLQLPSAVAYEVIHLFPQDTFSAVHYVLQCLDSPHAELDKETYEQLFVNAFQNKHFNICRVLWRYACMNESTTKPMRSTLNFLLTQNKASNRFSEWDQRWWTTAGKVIAGVCLHLPKYPLKDDLLRVIPPEFHDSPLSAFVNSGTVEGKERARQRTAAKAIVRHDYQIGAWYRPKYSVTHMLEAALALDKEWGSVPRPANWFLQNALDIPIELDLRKRKRHKR
ncbi:hypothetical protein AN4994.2 [Aspergillus nidulans FGSC A4]|uniref:Uncharacterized protein n=1 Tax=Emericella nidulans (strain FGSC A4 / ATCC 38163 / CBS 112.46 / NRRL 194 / M139) TaxID=227321 RepID=Q5B386_EMENI|nr:hypothetical protein [Aspergillus nidulans FGSC A4]EAA61072.1 hypothetical protein AN4994.2 [Aspergillus nidulans FGSC A4]CBF76322.1 TPA: conserved hypothetical protein [Aspergillus nidulans FGSC A4]|eukprot:XP_662598.1 hypothetical protein AN4994.2 [Aspergillus nidulans FGSC A4]